MSFICLCVCVTVWICFHVLGQTEPGARFGGGWDGVAGGGSRPQYPHSMALWSRTTGSQSPPVEAVPPCRANPLLLRINQLHSAGPYCAVKAPVRPPTLPQPPPPTIPSPAFAFTYPLITPLLSEMSVLTLMSLFPRLSLSFHLHVIIRKKILFTSHVTIFQTVEQLEIFQRQYESLLGNSC